MWFIWLWYENFYQYFSIWCIASCWYIPANVWILLTALSNNSSFSIFWFNFSTKSDLILRNFLHVKNFLLKFWILIIFIVTLSFFFLHFPNFFFNFYIINIFFNFFFEIISFFFVFCKIFIILFSNSKSSWNIRSKNLRINFWTATVNSFVLIELFSIIFSIISLFSKQFSMFSTIIIQLDDTIIFFQ